MVTRPSPSGDGRGDTSRLGADRIVVIVEPEIATGFRMAGATVVAAGSESEAGAALQRLLDEGERGVIAVHEPFFHALDPAVRARYEAMVAPVILPLPPGRGAVEQSRRARLTEMFQRVVGYQITFEEAES